MTAGRARSGAWRAVPRECAIVVSGIGVYFGVRGITESDVETAQRHADAVVDFEKALGIYHEPAIQGAVAHWDVLTTLMNWIYIWGHWPVIGVVLLWLAMQHPATYRVTRNAMIVSGLIGIVIFATFPVAPPRLAGLGLVDTVSLESSAYRVLQPPAFVNQYAAVPSLHFGWDLLIGIAVVSVAGHGLLRLLGMVMPVVMACAVILTANHYLVDIAAGGVVAMTGLVAARAWAGRGQAPAPPEPSPCRERTVSAAAIPAQRRHADDACCSIH